jgi:hypothetical protein
MSIFCSGNKGSYLSLFIEFCRCVHLCKGNRSSPVCLRKSSSYRFLSQTNSHSFKAVCWQDRVVWVGKVDRSCCFATTCDSGKPVPPPKLTAKAQQHSIAFCLHPIDSYSFLAAPSLLKKHIFSCSNDKTRISDTIYGQ